MGEPPPTDTMISAPESLKALTPFFIPAIGACWPISYNVAPNAPRSLRTSSTLFTTFVYNNLESGSDVSSRAY